MIRRQIIAATIVLLLLPLSVRGDFDYAKIADSATASPSGGTFGVFDSYPTIDGYSVAFNGQTLSGNTKGVYVGSGGAFAKIADNNTAIPGGGGFFTDFTSGSLSISNGKVAFAASDTVHSGPGVYTNVGGGLTTVADSTTPLPSGSGTFTYVGGVSLDGSNMAFFGLGVGGRLGIYSTLGGLHKVANQNDTPPGGSGTFTGFGNPSMSGGNMAFVGLGNSSGIYSDVGGTLHAVANTSTPIPNGVGNFTNLYILFAGLSFNSGKVAFPATGIGIQQGIYSDVSGTLQAVADAFTPIPNGSGSFTTFGSASLDSNGTIALQGYGSGGQQGIFTNLGGSLAPVVASGTSIDGKTVSTLSMSTRALSNGNVAFEATFSGGAGSGIYVAEQSYEYVANTSGTWDTAGNWSFGLKPRTAVYANIHPASGVVVTGPVSATTIRGLDLGAFNSGQAELRLQPSGQLTANEYMYFETLGKLSINGSVATAAYGIYNYGEIDLGGGQLNGGFFQNSGTLHGSGTVGNYVYNLATIQANNATQHYTDQVFNNQQIQIINSQVQVDGLTSNQFSPSDGVFGRIDVRNSLVAFNGGLSNIGSLNFSFGTSDVFGHINNGLLPPATPEGQIIVSGNSNVTFYDAVVHNGTLFRVSPGSTAIFFGPVSGAGAFTGGGTKIFEGGYSPGNSPAAVSLDGPVQFGATNTLKIELGGTTAGTQFDKVQVAGSLALDGTLQVTLVNSFAPARGNKFDILDWTTHTGTFLALQLPSLTTPLRWNIGQLYADGTLSVVDSTRLPGDFNRDTQVTSADLPVMLSALADLPGYEQLYGVSDSDLLAIGDFDNSGAFTNADMQGLLYLLSHGGIVLGSPSPAAPVPEPATFILLAIALLIAGFAVRRRLIQGGKACISPCIGG